MGQLDHISLIQKQLSNDITAEELVQLQDWINASEENKQAAATIASIWKDAELDDAELEQLANSVDLDTEFDLLKIRITADEQPAATKVIPMWRKYASIAAVFVVLIGATALILFNLDNASTEFAEIKTGDQPQEITLEDGSTVHLNANSTLKYPIAFTGSTREVELTGEAFFDIAKDPSHPFTIHTPYEDVSVLGTSFNIRSYAAEGHSEVAVATGKVKVENGTTNQILLPNEKVTVNHATGLMEQEITKNLNENAWLTKQMIFEDALLPEVVDDLEAYFKIHFEIQNADLLSCPFDASFNFAETDDLNTVLTTISRVFDLQPKETKNGGYILVGGSCE